MNYETEHIVTAIKDARVRKGFSQRELSANSGVPQAQISKFENGSVDLRISSLVALVRALDLELELVPRKAVPAVKSIVRSTAQSPTIDVATYAKAETAIEKIRRALAKQDMPFKEVDRLYDSLRALEKLRVPATESEKLYRLLQQMDRLKWPLDDLNTLTETTKRIEQFRNQITHAPALSDQDLLPKPAYSLDEEDDDA